LREKNFKKILQFLLICTFLTILLTTITTTAATTGTIEVTDASEITYNFTDQQLQEMPKTIVNAELYCYGNLVASGDWIGVQLNFLLKNTNVNSDVKSIQFAASDGYIVTIPIQLAIAPETIIAYQKDGEPVPGLRLVLPGINGASWIAQIISITMCNAEVDAPTAASGPGARGDLVANFIESRQTLPTPTIIPEQTQHTPQQVPDDAKPNPTVLPTNVTKSIPIGQQTAENQTIPLDSEIIIFVAIIFAVGVAIAGITTFKLKNKLKERFSRKNN
jgi:hypothetical protein